MCCLSWANAVSYKTKWDITIGIVTAYSLKNHKCMHALLHKNVSQKRDYRVLICLVYAP